MARKYKILQDWNGGDERIIINPRGQMIRFLKMTSYEVDKKGNYSNPVEVIRKFFVGKAKK